MKLKINDGPPTKKTYTIKSGGIGEVIKVTINLDGKIQTIDLNNVN